MNLRALSFGLVACLFAVVGSSACDGSLLSSDCGSNACGACQTGFVNVDRCEDGEWKCDCVPRSGDAAAPSEPDGGGDATFTPDPRPVFTCSQALASPTTSALCDANDWDESCDQGCLTCRCNGGTWGCTTNPSCFDSGGGGN
jgi:hypothetical protein